MAVWKDFGALQQASYTWVSSIKSLCINKVYYSTLIGYN